MFDIGPGELLALAVVALLVLGPDKLPRYAADAARFLRQIRKLANDARTEVTKEIGPELEGLDLRDINPRALVRKHLLDGIDLDDEADAPRPVNGSNGSSAANGTTAANGASAVNGSAAARSSAVESAGGGPASVPFDPDTT